MASILSRPRNDSPVPQTSRRANSIIAATQGARSNPVAQMGAMTDVGILFAIVDRLATSCSQSQWHLYRKARSGNPDDRVEVMDHLALRIWNKPNPFTTRSELIEASQQHFELTGLAVMVVGRSARASLPLELWNVRSDRVRAVPHPTKFIAGYIYTSPDGEEVPLAVEDVITIRRPSPLDPYGSIAPVQAVSSHLEGEKLSAEYNRNFFRNGAEPGGVIEVERTLSDAEFDEMTARWREQHQGVGNAHRVAVLENAHYVERKFTQKDMEFSGLSKLSDDKIRQAYGIHNAILGGTEDINRANAEAGEYVYARWLLVNRFERWKQALNNDFLPLFGDGSLEFDYDSPVPDDETAENAERDSKVNAVVQLVPAGFDATEVLEWADLPNFTYAKPAPPPPPVPPPGSAPDGTGGADPTTTALLELVRLLGGGRQARAGHGGAKRCDCDADDDWHGARHGRGLIDTLGDVPATPDGITPRLPDAYKGEDLSGIQSAWEDELASLLDHWGELSAAQQESLLDQVSQIVANGDVVALSGLAVQTHAGAVALEEAMSRLGLDAASKVAAEAGRQGVPDVHAMAPERHRTAATAQVYAALLGISLAQSAAREALRTWAPGATAATVRDAVAAHLAGLTDAEPRMILGAALSQAQRDGRYATIAGGPEAALYADEVLDKNTCKPCRAVNRRWVGNSSDPAMIAQTYPVAGYVGCLGRWRCRGQIVAVWRGGSDWTKWVELPDQRTS